VWTLLRRRSGEDFQDGVAYGSWLTASAAPFNSAALQMNPDLLRIRREKRGEAGAEEELH
jgi:hypothetical protein